MAAGEGDGAFSYQYGPADTVRQDLVATQTQLVGAINNLEQYSTQQLMFWTSHARDVYNTVKTDWDRNVNEMTDILQRLHIGLGDIHLNYVSTENRATSRW